jgi:hypothetical protein
MGHARRVRGFSYYIIGKRSPFLAASFRAIRNCQEGAAGRFIFKTPSSQFLLSLTCGTNTVYSCIYASTFYKYV